MSGRLTVLRAALLEADLSQVQLARLIGKDPATVSRILNGWRCSREVQVQIAGVLDRPVERLFTEHGGQVPMPVDGSDGNERKETAA